MVAAKSLERLEKCLKKMPGSKLGIDNLLWSAAEGKVLVEVFDGMCRIQVALPVETDLEGGIATLRGPVQQWLSYLSKDIYALSWEERCLRLGEHEFDAVERLPAAEFPQEWEPLLLEELRPALVEAAKFVSKDPTYPALSGVYVAENGVVATDLRTMLFVEVASPFSDLLFTISGWDLLAFHEDEASYFLGESSLFIKSDDLITEHPFLKDVYPEAILATATREFGSSFTVSLPEFVEAMGHTVAHLMGVHLAPVVMVVAEGTLTISVQGERGRGKEVLEITGGVPEEVLMNGEMFLALLKSMKGDDVEVRYDAAAPNFWVLLEGKRKYFIAKMRSN